MIICHSRRFVVFSNPKTGSETLRHIFAPWNEETIVPYRDRTPLTPYYPHMSPAELAAEFATRGSNLDAYMRISVVRNPFARLVSLYRMIGTVDRVWRLRRSCGLGLPDFGRWVQSTAPNGRGGGGREHQRWRRFGTWSAQAWCGDLVTHTIRTEHMASDLAPILSALGIAPSGMPRLNAQGDLDLADWYTPDLIQTVSCRYSSDLARFGYRPPALALVSI